MHTMLTNMIVGGNGELVFFVFFIKHLETFAFEDSNGLHVFVSSQLLTDKTGKSKRRSMR